MNNFKFSNTILTASNLLINENPVCSDLLFSICENMRVNCETEMEVSLSDIELLNPAFELNIIKKNEQVVSFSDNNFFVYFLGFHICSNELIQAFNTPEQFLYEHRKISFEYINFDELRDLGSVILIILNNSFNKDVCTLFLDVTKDSIWEINHIFERSLPYLHINIDSLIQAITIIKEFTQNDMTSGTIYSAVRKLCEHQPKTGDALFKSLSKNPESKIVYFIPSILAGLSTAKGLDQVYNIAFDLTEDQNTTFIQCGIISLSLFIYSDEQKYLNRTLERLESFLEDNRVMPVKAITKAYGNLIQLNEIIKTKLVILSNNKDPDIQYELSNILFHNSSKYRDEEWFKEILINLADVDIQYKGIIDNLDNCLHEYIDNDIEYIFIFLSKWIISHTENNKFTKIDDIFGWTLRDLSNEKKSVMEKHLTKWFNKDDRRFHLTASHILNHISNDDKPGFLLDKITLDKFSKEDVIFVLRKILGYIRENKTLCRLVFSILQREPEVEQINREVISVFNNYLSYNYPGISKEYLTAKVENCTDVEKKVAETILKSMESYYKPLRERIKLKEFEPPEKRVRAYANMKERKQNEMMRSSTVKGSILMELAKKVTLKGGKKWLTKYNGQFLDKSELSEFSYSYEMPRGEFLDPIGQQYIRIQWCSYTRNEVKDETDNP